VLQDCMPKLKSEPTVTRMATRHVHVHTHLVRRGRGHTRPARTALLPAITSNCSLNSPNVHPLL